MTFRLFFAALLGFALSLPAHAEVAATVLFSKVKPYNAVVFAGVDCGAATQCRAMAEAACNEYLDTQMREQGPFAGADRAACHAVQDLSDNVSFVSIEVTLGLSDLRFSDWVWWAHVKRDPAIGNVIGYCRARNRQGCSPVLTLLSCTAAEGMASAHPSIRGISPSVSASQACQEVHPAAHVIAHLLTMGDDDLVLPYPQ